MAENLAFRTALTWGAGQLSRFAPDKLHCFPGDYFEAHERFCQAANALGWELEYGHVDSAEPIGRDADLMSSPLTVAAAISPNTTESRRTLVLSTGLHGIEAYFGSAVLLQLLEDWRRHGPPDVRVVLLHSLNPFGFANQRRVDALNVDLNRNFLVAGEEYVGAPRLYSHLDPFLNPMSSWESNMGFYTGAISRIARYGIHRVRDAIAQGQYEYPRGLFYGGQQPSQLSRWLSQKFPSWLNNAKRVVHVDFHTGLGRWGDYQLFVESQYCDAERLGIGRYFSREQWIQLPRLQNGQPHQKMYRARGAFGPWCEELFLRTASDLQDADLLRPGQPASSTRTIETDKESTRRYLFAVAEFGTYSSLRVLNALRRENAAVQSCEASIQKDGNSRLSENAKKASMQQEKQGLLEAFCPSSEQWRQKVLAGAAEIIERMLKLLEESST